MFLLEIYQFQLILISLCILCPSISSESCDLSRCLFTFCFFFVFVLSAFVRLNFFCWTFSTIQSLSRIWIKCNLKQYLRNSWDKLRKSYDFYSKIVIFSSFQKGDSSTNHLFNIFIPKRGILIVTQKLHKKHTRDFWDTSNYPRSQLNAFQKNYFLEKKMSKYWLEKLWQEIHKRTLVPKTVFSLLRHPAKS